jgi:hypothetical protein
MKSGLVSVMIGVIAFGLGIAAATPIKSAVIAITGGESIRCVRTVCVGDAPFPGLERSEITDRIGGLSAIWCGEMRAYPGPRLLRINSLVAGETCVEPVFRLDFNERTTVTSIEVSEGRISEIRTHPVDAITWP